MQRKWGWRRCARRTIISTRRKRSWNIACTGLIPLFVWDATRQTRFIWSRRVFCTCGEIERRLVACAERGNKTFMCLRITWVSRVLTTLAATTKRQTVHFHLRPKTHILIYMMKTRNSVELGVEETTTFGGVASERIYMNVNNFSERIYANIPVAVNVNVREVGTWKY